MVNVVSRGGFIEASSNGAARSPGVNQRPGRREDIYTEQAIDLSVD